jgi:predicted nucleic acid-binding protein
MPDTPRPRLVISNATPIIAPALIGQLDLLQKLYGQVMIPPAVAAEILAGGQRAGAMELPNAAYIQTTPLLDPRRADLLSDLDRGEAEVLALAQERQADLVIMDERLGRRHARRLGFTLTGVLGVLLRAKQQNHLGQLQPLIIQLQQGGIHLSDPPVERVLYLAGEGHDE